MKSGIAACVAAGINLVIAFLMSTAGAAGSPTTPVGPANQVIVPGSSVGTATGVVLFANERFTSTATGLVNTKPSDPANLPVGPNGGAYLCNPSCLLPSAHYGALIGRIGNAGPWFFVGAQATITADRAGLLFLGVDDDYSPDNTGQFTVTLAPPVGPVQVWLPIVSR